MRGKNKQHLRCTCNVHGLNIIQLLTVAKYQGLVSSPSAKCYAGEPGERGQLVGSAVRMIPAIVMSLPVKRGILSSFENGATDFVASNDFFSSQAPDGVCFLAE